MRWLLLVAATQVAGSLSAQAIEDVIIETVSVQPDPEGGPVPLTTYRIHVDLAEGHQLQMMYGDARHQLLISTTTHFFNDTVNGGTFATDINGGGLDQWPLALDTWLTIGSASDRHRGVPQNLDPDGSLLQCPPYAPATQAMNTGSDGPSLCLSDGLVRDSITREVVSFRFASGFLHRTKGGLLETTDGAWAMLGGMKGATPDNMVLIAQVSTTGRIAFRLNAQVAGPDRRPMKYVWKDPAPGEVLFEGLSFGERH